MCARACVPACLSAFVRAFVRLETHPYKSYTRNSAQTLSVQLLHAAHSNVKQADLSQEHMKPAEKKRLAAVLAARGVLPAGPCRYLCLSRVYISVCDPAGQGDNASSRANWLAVSLECACSPEF